MVRYPAVAGQFYAGKEASLRREVEACFNSPIGPGHLPKLESGPRNIVGAVVPHAGLAYSGPVAAHVYAALAKDGFPGTFVIVGPNHNGIGAGVATTEEDFETPFGVVSIDQDIVSKLKGVVENDPVSHRFEHSIEVQLPFLQYIKRDIKIGDGKGGQEGHRLPGRLRYRLHGLLPLHPAGKGASAGHQGDREDPGFGPEGNVQHGDIK